MTLLPINKNNDVEMLIIVPQTIGDNLSGIISNYLAPLGSSNATKVLVASVYTPTKGVLKKAIFEEEWGQIEEVIETYDIKYIAIAQPDYFNKILKAKKKLPFERLIGDVKEIDGIKITPILNYLAVSITPSKKKLLQRSVDTMKALLDGTYTDNREEFLKSLKIEVVKDFDRAYELLKKYSKEDKLAVDIETSGLKWYEDELLTIAFSKNETEGFCVALHEKFSSDWYKNRKLVKRFFEQYRGKVIGFNFAFDLQFIVKALWMNGLSDIDNMIKGVNYFDLEDARVIAYLVLNNVDRPALDLKTLANIKYGEWDKDIDQSKLLYYKFEVVGRYNVIDTCATMYVYNEYNRRLDEEEQRELYETIYKPFMPAIIKMQMQGLTIDKDQLVELDEHLTEIYNKNKEFLEQTEEVKETIELLKEEAKLKGKRQTEIDKIKFNPKSTIQLQKLLYEVMNLPILNRTDTGNPSADKNTLFLLLKMYDEDSKEYKIINALYEIALMKNVQSSFAHKMPKIAIKNEKGDWKIYSNYNVAKVVSGRLSSSGSLNLQNLPSGSSYGSYIKKSLIAEKGYIIGYVDYSSLENRVMANFINSYNMKKVYKEGFDSHMFNLVRLRPNLLKEKGIDIDINDPEQVNALKEELKKERNAIKPAVFSLLYFSSAKGLANTLKIPEQEAESLYEEFHKTYPELNEYIDKVEEELLEKGYCTAVMGMRIRCDLSSIKNKQKYAKALRTVGNALIQNSGLLMVRSIAKFQQWIENNNLQLDVRPFMTTHDSLGFYVKPDVNIIYKVNEKLIEILLEPYPTMDIPNEAEIEIGKNLNDLIVISNNATKEEIKEKLDIIMKG